MQEALTELSNQCYGRCKTEQTQEAGGVSGVRQGDCMKDTEGGGR